MIKGNLCGKGEGSREMLRFIVRKGRRERGGAVPFTAV